ncbi:hypothetical protein N7478_010272 [Penicillium angulare]|uniref:uncharacterized protein n=1 Tax=Penicillium angulare TaxID=116970 RepID=UPI00253FE7EF|nr:uncharacterized protein N7478_010272 [Penicillium angulare]KAJ5267464.1 hypothetical protein N7478_010272 [Penicillium angulare]
MNSKVRELHQPNTKARPLLSLAWVHGDALQTVNTSYGSGTVVKGQTAIANDDAQSNLQPKDKHNSHQTRAFIRWQTKEAQNAQNHSYRV